MGSKISIVAAKVYEKRPFYRLFRARNYTHDQSVILFINIGAALPGKELPLSHQHKRQTQEVLTDRAQTMDRN